MLLHWQYLLSGDLVRCLCRILEKDSRKILGIKLEDGEAVETEDPGVTVTEREMLQGYSDIDCSDFLNISICFNSTFGLEPNYIKAKC